MLSEREMPFGLPSSQGVCGCRWDVPGELYSSHGATNRVSCSKLLKVNQVTLLRIRIPYYHYGFTV